MKKLELVVVAIFISLFGKSQTVGGVHISKIDAEYIELVGQSSILKPFKVSLSVDYGQAGSIKEARNNYGLMDSKGNAFKVNGMMGALNLFANNGWELHSTMLLTHSNKSVYHYILKKKADGSSITTTRNQLNNNLKQPELDTLSKKRSTLPSDTESGFKGKYSVGQKVYFYKKDKLIESKIIYVDTIGKMCNTGCIKVEYSDANKTKTKYLTFDKVLITKP